MRVSASRAAAAVKAKQKTKKSVSAGSGYKATSATKWVMPGAQKKGAGAWGKPVAKKKPAKGGSVFAAMMMDSDSD